MGVRDDGDDPVTLAQTGCPCARGQGSDHDFVALVVPGSAGFEAQFDLVGMRTFDLTGPVKRREERRGFKCEELVVSPKGQTFQHLAVFCTLLPHREQDAACWR